MSRTSLFLIAGLCLLGLASSAAYLVLRGESGTPGLAYELRCAVPGDGQQPEVMGEAGSATAIDALRRGLTAQGRITPQHRCTVRASLASAKSRKL